MSVYPGETAVHDEYVAWVARNNASADHTVRANLRLIRRRRGMRTSVLGAALGVAAATIAAREFGSRAVKAADLPRYAAALGCDVRDFFRPLAEESK